MDPNSPLPDWMKPNNARVIVRYAQSGNFKFLEATPMGRHIPPRAIEYLKGLSKNNGVPLAYAEILTENGEYTNKYKVIAHGPLEFVRAFAGQRINE
jgi:hypothetical protein